MAQELSEVTEKHVSMASYQNTDYLRLLVLHFVRDINIDNGSSLAML